MTLDEMRQSAKKFLAPSDVAEVLGCRPYSINVTVKLRGISAYPFTLFLSGNRVRIPRKAFIEWAEKVRL